RGQPWEDAVRDDRAQAKVILAATGPVHLFGPVRDALAQLHTAHLRMPVETCAARSARSLYWRTRQPLPMAFENTDRIRCRSSCEGFAITSDFNFEFPASAMRNRE